MGKIEKKIVEYYKFFKQNWNSILAVISISGYFIGSYWPPFKQYSNIFLFLGANAIIWTLIELKINLINTVLPQRFDDMRYARPDILNNIKKVMSKSNNHPEEIKIIGGRIRTISDYVREIKDDIVNGRLNARNTNIELFCIDPVAIANFDLSGLKDQENFKKRMLNYSDLIKRFSDEILEYNNLDEFKQRKITIKIYHYKSFPVLYAYIIGKDCLFWGYYTWESKKEEFDGPTNPCFYMKNGMDNFDDYSEWLNNRANFLKLIS